jgi:hypothetical protein
MSKNFQCEPHSFDFYRIILEQQPFLFRILPLQLICSVEIQGDQKVSVHLLITITIQGAQSLFGHPVQCFYSEVRAQFLGALRKIAKSDA